MDSFLPRLIDAEVKKLPQKPGTSMTGTSPKPATGTKRPAESDEEDDEVRAFKRRPKAAVNRPMTIPPVDRARKQVIDAAMAKANPNASFAERVAQFDRLTEISQKRKLMNPIIDQIYKIRQIDQYPLFLQRKVTCLKTY